MSTREKLCRHIDCGNLVQYAPRGFYGDDEPERGLFVSWPLYRWLEEIPTALDERQRRSFMRQQLAVYVFGRNVDNVHYMKRLKKSPHDIWEIRMQTMPKYRLFGFFAFPDAFVCSHLWPRRWLGKFDSKQWKQAKQESADLWDRWFPAIPRFQADNFTRYVTWESTHYDWNLG